MGLFIVLHLLAAILWGRGGMAFALACLRPATMDLEPGVRIRLWRQVLGRFLPLVLASVVVLIATGYVLLFGWFGGFRTAPVYVHIMHLTGWLMALLFFHLFFAPWRRFRAAVDTGDNAAAGAQLGQIRRIVTINLILGLVTAAIATGRYWLV